MRVEDWLQYYQGMVLRANMRPEKIREMVANCGQKKTMVKDPANPLKEIEQIEPFEEAVERIRNEVLEMSSKESLEKRANELIIELRRR